VPLTAVNFVTKGPVLHNDLLQFFNLFTGVMVDQPVTFKNTLTVGGNQGSTTVPVKLYGSVGQTTHLLDLYADNTNANPGWGIGASGAMAWGPGGAGVQDTFLSRVATQNGHSTDTAGLLIQPYLDLAGSMQMDGTLNWKTSGASIFQNAAGSLGLGVNQDLSVNRNVSIGNYAGALNGSRGLIVGGNALFNATSDPQTGISCFPVMGHAMSYASGIDVGVATDPGSYTVGNAYAINVYEVTRGSGVTISNDIGIHIAPRGLGSGSNIGLLIEAPTGPGSNAIMARGQVSLATVVVDLDAQNDGTVGTPWLIFAAGGEGVLSPRTAAAPNRFGLSLVTGSTRRFDITNAGNFIGLTSGITFQIGAGNSFLQWNDTNHWISSGPQNSMRFAEYGDTFYFGTPAQVNAGIQAGGHYYCRGTVSGQSPGSAVNGSYAFSANNNSGGAGQGIAYAWATYSSVDHARQFGLKVAPIADAVGLMHSVSAYSYDHTNYTTQVGEEGISLLRDDKGALVATPSYGFSAAEIARDIPEAASIDLATGEAIGVDPYRLLAVLWEACQQMETRLAALEGVPA
jgi:hypothetical protein